MTEKLLNKTDRIRRYPNCETRLNNGHSKTSENKQLPSFQNREARTHTFSNSCQKHLKEARATPKVWKILEVLK